MMYRLHGHTFRLEDMQEVAEAEGFAVGRDYYDQMFRTLRGFQFPLTIYRGLSLPKREKPDLNKKRLDMWWTWNAAVAQHFACGTHYGTESHGRGEDGWIIRAQVPTPKAIDWPDSVEQYLRFSSPWADAAETDDSLVFATPAFRKLRAYRVRC